MEKGKLGYIDHIKKKNLTFGITGIAAMFAIYIVGLMITGSNASYATLVAVLLALPAAQMLARYFSLSKYKSTDRDLLDAVELKGVKAMYELPLVCGKKSYYIEAAAISQRGLEILSNDPGIDAKSIGSLLRSKGIVMAIHLHMDRSEFLDHLTGEGQDTEALYKLKENAL